MNPVPTAEEGKQSLRDHVVRKAMDARHQRGGQIDRAGMMRLLEDRAVVRYPLGVRFDAGPLRPGEFACLESLGERPTDGFCLYVHPVFENVDELIPLLIAYYIPSVNYGEVASHIESELFGSTLLGIEVEEYYTILCSVADTVAGNAGGVGAGLSGGTDAGDDVRPLDQAERAACP
ncbi:MAG: hypothetical protein Q8L55_11150 [Phycisphaerales bacterium]|nr:hypothetical protein [Phycisphaerales bacterium]